MPNEMSMFARTYNQNFASISILINFLLKIASMFVVIVSTFD